MNVCSKLVGRIQSLAILTLWHALAKTGNSRRTVDSFQNSLSKHPFLNFGSRAAPNGLAVHEPTVDQPTLETPDSVLVDPDWLESNIGRDDVILIGLGQDPQQYAAAHIPGELFTDWKTDIVDEENYELYNLPSPQRHANLLSRLGATRETTIVLTDNMSSRLAARMFWSLRCYGHRRIKVLDGGRRAWVQSGRSFTSVSPVVLPTTYPVSQPDQNLIAQLETVQNAVDSVGSVIIDSRPEEQYAGSVDGTVFHTGKQHSRRGHIPGSVNVAWTENFDRGGRFRPAEELRKIYLLSGVDEQSDVVTYCNEGIHAASPWFVLTQILGYSNVRLYDASIAEWADETELPLEID